MSVDDSLRKFALERLNAAAYPDCRHDFTPHRCSKCSGDTFEPEIQRQPGESPRDFLGVLRVACSKCGEVAEALSVITSGGPALLPAEHPTCPCGGRRFHLASCDRWESWDFFDEGTVVAACADCGALQALLDTD